MYVKELFTKPPNPNANLITRKLNYMQQVASSLAAQSFGFIWVFLKYKLRITYISTYNQSPESIKK